MSFPNKFFNRGNPLRELLSQGGQYEILVDGDTYWTIILPDSTAAAPYNLSITALYADGNTELTGTIEIIDRFVPAGGLEPLRVLKTIALSKTAVAA